MHLMDVFHIFRAKRIVTEDSPNFFLTVSEDHTVRQHDLRTSHTCGPNGSCPAPIVKLPYSLSTLACSPVTPWYFVVAGESVFGHLFDRRMVGRILRLEWGQNIIDDDEDENSTRCVRRFGRLKRGPKELKGSSHITAARMAKTNGHELLLSYSGDAAYLYNIRDTPFEPPRRQPSIVLPNKPSSTSRSSHKKPASPSSPISSSKRRKIENERSVSPTWASAPTTNQQGPSRLEAVDEGNDKALLNGNTAAEWSGVEGQGDPSGTGDEDEIPVVDSNDIRSQTLETSESGAAAEGSPYVNGEEEQSQAQETQDGDGSEGGGENENEDNSGEDEGDSEDEDEDEDEDGDDDDFVDREEGEDDTEEAGYVQESNGGAAWDTLNTPIVMPNKRFAGARNVETYKDVNFLGASDDYVCSGSDDGHFFLWSKAMTKLVGIWEGDGSVVNVIEDRPAHHSFPMLAVSGIDHTVKVCQLDSAASIPSADLLFAPTPSEPRPFCHTSRAAEIVRANSIRAAPRMMRLSRMQMALLQAHLGLEGGDTNREDCCIM
ncbi:hypothetical protein FRB97_000539 [Tulasnella sp. 331]|nr:hypothetical protein FRB97_000539 [Tulasnella sp. 331]